MKFFKTDKLTLKIIFLICITAFCCFHFLHSVCYFIIGYDNAELTLNDFETYEAEIIDSNTLINDGDDTQIIYTGNVKNLKIKCSFSQNPGEVIAVYSYNDDYSWSTDRLIYAKIIDGYYYFEFPFRTKQIRFDTGVTPSITVDFESIEINSKNIYSITGFNYGEIIYIIILPILIFNFKEIIFKLYNQLKQDKL